MNYLIVILISINLSFAERIMIINNSSILQLQEDVEMALTKNTQHIVIDRKHTQQIVNEHKFQTSGLVDEKSSIELGKLIGADKIFFMYFEQTNHSNIPIYYITIKIVNVENGVILSVKKGNQELIGNYTKFSLCKAIENTLIDYVNEYELCNVYPKPNYITYQNYLNQEKLNKEYTNSQSNKKYWKVGLFIASVAFTAYSAYNSYSWYKTSSKHNDNIKNTIKPNYMLCSELYTNNKDEILRYTKNSSILKCRDEFANWEREASNYYNNIDFETNKKNNADGYSKGWLWASLASSGFSLYFYKSF